MSKYIQAAQTISTLLLDVEGFLGDFSIEPEETSGLVITVTKSAKDLAETGFSSVDFQLFCEQNQLSGVIFFNRDNTVTFSMAPIPSLKG